MTRTSSLPPPGDIVVRLRDVSKTYLLGAVAVPGLHELSLEIGRATFSVIVGPSGSGKTTLLNLIGGIDRPSAGTVEVAGQDLGGLGDDRRSDFRARNIGFIFQSFNLIPVLSAYENVEYPLLLTRVAAAERRRRVMALLDAVGIGDQSRRRPNQMSGGQRQRVAIARALVKDPVLVLADEPTANLDSRTGAQIIALMHAMQTRCRTSFVVSSHDPQVMEQADETFTIRDGALIDRHCRATS
ncbi:MAG: ATP-binding cassette domain-containing protein [Azospirillum sp.]|nr:ATP-binding cassette domain-containing protein [Azospirillum sp.]